MADKSVRIGGFSAFWGDTSTGAAQLVDGGQINYLIGDYLAEVTMGILGRLKQMPPRGGAGEGGYVAEFVSDVVRPLLKDCLAKNIKIVTNAGGMNPVACKLAIEALAEKQGLPKPIVAAIVGDDMMPVMDQLSTDGKILPFNVEGEVEDLSITKKAPVLSCNVYLGAFPIAKALAEGAQIVVTGRCVDSALALGPLIHEFGWRADQLDLLAAGSVAGHLIECATQSTGGNFTDWELSAAGGWDNVGFPIVDCKPDGSFILTKPDNTGGLVSKGTVGEQMVYEILDPENYLLPDVNVDFTQITLQDLPPINNTGRVLVKGAKGKPAPATYKASITVVEGYRLDGILMIGGRDASAKAQATGNAILAKVNRLLQQQGVEPIKRYKIEPLGTEYTYGAHSTKQDAREVLLRFVARHTNKKALELLAKEVAPAATSMAPGITGGGSGRPRPTPALGYRSALIPKAGLPIQIHVGSKEVVNFVDPVQGSSAPIKSTRRAPQKASKPNPAQSVTVPLIKLAHGRSGDKGDVCNIGIICRRPEHFELVKSQLTEEAVKEYLKHLVFGGVFRYELPGTSALNFVCTRALGGGGLNSMNIDRQGKCYAQMLLDFPISIPVSGLAKL